MNAPKYNRFRGGWQGAVYTCAICGKRTRETGDGESGVGLCRRCYEKAGDENAVSDGQMTQEEFEAKWGK